MASALDRVLLAIAPTWALRRIRSRAAATTLARHYEAASSGRRTENWNRRNTDANAASLGAIVLLRASARDLIRNNPWAKRGLNVIGNNTVGWGIIPKATDGDAAGAMAAWKKWAATTDCDADGRLTFYGIQRQIVETVAESGEVLVRRRFRRIEDGYAIPLQLQLLEPDYIDTTRNNMKGIQGGPVIQGIEFDAIGRRVAYWLFDNHPGASLASYSIGSTSDVTISGATIGSGLTSRRVSADDIIHVHRLERPGQVRGVSWFAPVLLRLREFDEYEDATLMRQKIAACFAAFVKDVDGSGTALGETDASSPTTETMEPGLVSYLPPGRDITFATPPGASDDGFTTRTLRAVAAGLGVTFEDLTGDYSQVNFSSARMARLAHWANVHDWRWNMLVPQFCDPAWGWAMEAARLAGLIGAVPSAEWTPPPMPMIEPDKEGLAISRMVRNGAMTISAMVREQGEDPDAHFKEYAEDLARLDRLGIKLDCDVRATTAAGQAQAEPAANEPAVPGDGAARPPMKNGKAAKPPAPAA